MIRSNALRLSLPVLSAVLAFAGCKREQPAPAPEPTAAATATPKPVAPANMEFPTLEVATIDGKTYFVIVGSNKFFGFFNFF